MKNKTLLDYKKSLGDWHYNPMIKSTDYQYVGRFVTDFSQHIKNVDWGEPETAIDIWEEDKDKPMDVHNLAWGKQQHIDAGYTKHNTKKYQLFNSDKVPEIFNKMADISGLDNYSVALFRQNPGQINHWHFDTYQGVVNEYKKQGKEFDYVCCIFATAPLLKIDNIKLGLQKNNLPFDDAGIEQTWEFAHPNNQRVTGFAGTDT